MLKHSGIVRIVRFARHNPPRKKSFFRGCRKFGVRTGDFRVRSATNLGDLATIPNNIRTRWGHNTTGEASIALVLLVPMGRTSLDLAHGTTHGRSWLSRRRVVPVSCALLSD
jgi:hypothetical protein